MWKQTLDSAMMDKEGIAQDSLYGCVWGEIFFHNCLREQVRRKESEYCLTFLEAVA